MAEGHALYKTAIKAKALLPEGHDLTKRQWNVFLSPNYPEKQFQEIVDLAANDPSISVQHNLPAEQFRESLTNAALSISLSGYNTIAETYSTGVPAVIASYNGSKEQNFRAERFAALGRMEVLQGEKLHDPKELATLIDHAYIKKSTPLQDLKVNGEQVLAEFVSKDIAVPTR